MTQHKIHNLVSMRQLGMNLSLRVLLSVIAVAVPACTRVQRSGPSSPAHSSLASPNDSSAAGGEVVSAQARGTTKHSIDDLAHLVGIWDCKEIFHAGGWTPKQVISENARDVFSWGPGKKFILADYESVSELGLFEAHDVIFWDDVRGEFKFFFFDSFSGGVQVQGGALTDDALTFSHRTEMNGRMGLFVRTYRFQSPTTQSLEVEFRPDGGDAVKIATIHKIKRT
jgi:Protein of unknown function (DUF1579)